MAKIVDPDQLTQSTEIIITTGAKTIQLLAAGNLDDDAPGVTSGVTLQAVYSFLKEEWMTDSALNKFRFPIKAIYEAKFIMVNGWDWADEQTRDLIRDAGWQETNGDEYATIISLGLMDDDANDQAYYQHTSGSGQFSVIRAIRQTRKNCMPLPNIRIGRQRMSMTIRRLWGMGPFMGMLRCAFAILSAIPCIPGREPALIITIRIRQTI